MKELTDPQIRASFVNCTKGEASRLAVPRDLSELPWEDLDFLGWRDPGAPQRSYIVAEHEGRLVGFSLRLAPRTGNSYHRAMCSICLTTHPASGVTLMTARKARETGNSDDTVGEYICSNLACSLYVRGKKRAQPGGRLKESLTEEEKVERMKTKLADFLNKLF
ncbi:FBP domain-containing protein [Streptomyces sp. NPDC056486]|uniref:FBP domain-containing protein n=1 Tax=Streptomyces sp. NPDC056486 TaxID=3345835 RepID=UPI00367F3F54